MRFLGKRRSNQVDYTSWKSPPRMEGRKIKETNKLKEHSNHRGRASPCWLCCIAMTRMGWPECEGNLLAGWCPTLPLLRVIIPMLSSAMMDKISGWLLFDLRWPTFLFFSFWGNPPTHEGHWRGVACSILKSLIRSLSHKLVKRKGSSWDSRGYIGEMLQILPKQCYIYQPNGFGALGNIWEMDGPRTQIERE